MRQVVTPPGQSSTASTSGEAGLPAARTSPAAAAPVAVARPASSESTRLRRGLDDTATIRQGDARSRKQT